MGMSEGNNSDKRLKESSNFPARDKNMICSMGRNPGAWLNSKMATEWMFMFIPYKYGIMGLIMFDSS
jgi:hypothetical protein